MATAKRKHFLPLHNVFTVPTVSTKTEAIGIWRGEKLPKNCLQRADCRKQWLKKLLFFCFECTLDLQCSLKQISLVTQYTTSLLVFQWTPKYSSARKLLSKKSFWKNLLNITQLQRTSECTTEAKRMPLVKIAAGMFALNLSISIFWFTFEAE